MGFIGLFDWRPRTYADDAWNQARHVLTGVFGERRHYVAVCIERDGNRRMPE